MNDGGDNPYAAPQADTQQASGGVLRLCHAAVFGWCLAFGVVAAYDGYYDVAAFNFLLGATNLALSVRPAA